jgi:anaerobic magnesium-protoporphyrin IX monomethyl ester cyclase
MAMECQYKRLESHTVDWNPVIYDSKIYDKVITEPENLPFLSLPHPDRVFTRAKEYTSGNYKYLPGTHIMSASGCWWGKCSFCVENSKPYEVRPVEDVISEIEECKSLGFKEVFDDSATFPFTFQRGEWLRRFILEISRINIRFSCNCRIGDYDFDSLGRAGFRMLLFGIESANQITLDKINKGVKVEDIIPTIKRAARCGLEPHLAVMFGYPWESEQDAKNTLILVHYLLRKGYAKTAQASLYCPKDNIRNETHKKFVKKIYEVGYSPEFWFNRLRSIKNVSDIQYVWRGIKAWYQS